MKIGLIGDYDCNVTAHKAIPIAFDLIIKKHDFFIDYEWVPTETITKLIDLDCFDALWCVPGSPYKDMGGALLAIQCARERKIPFLGTCGGFQHALIEYARNVLGLTHADHAEIAPEAKCLIITPLVCSLLEKKDSIEFLHGSKIAKAYGKIKVSEGYHCGFGFNTEFESRFVSNNFIITGRDNQGNARSFELADHPFFVATLFQPERTALKGIIPPLVLAFIKAGASANKS